VTGPLGQFRVPHQALATLAAGRGDRSTLRLLHSAQLSKHLLLLRYLAGSSSLLDRPLAVLAAAHRRAPGPVGDLLASPFVGAWAARCVRSPQPAALSYVGNLAVAAALRTGLAAEVPVEVRDGRVFLPGYGGAAVDGETAVVTPDPGLRLRRLVADAGGYRLDVVLDDLDPYRDCYRMAVAPRVADADIPHWTELFGAAWRLLVRYDPAHATELAYGLRCLVPLVRGEDGVALSATSGDAVGAVALTPPDDPASLAVTLVHEFQHSKLSTLLDLVPLYDPSSTATFYAPWRRDPRPIGGLLQGAYAFLGVCEMWRRLRECPAEREVAQGEFAAVREQVAQVLTTLAASGLLTPLGERFVAGMRAALAPMLDERLPATVVASAQDSLAQNHDAWQQRNLS
jgi:HEXXH motif-containing protein